ncbi:hypothetical protein BY996DRAFT_6508082 [Phakopsora pachyrhizi]|nr:hypothetical protein BY996DRAFT_6508082 [Phakopsora pachyrhizi]
MEGGGSNQTRKLWEGKREVSVGLVRRCIRDRRRTDIRYFSEVVVEKRLDRIVGPVGLWHWAVKVGRRARQQHTVVRLVITLE